VKMKEQSSYCTIQSLLVNKRDNQILGKGEEHKKGGLKKEGETDRKRKRKGRGERYLNITHNINITQKLKIREVMGGCAN